MYSPRIVPSPYSARHPQPWKRRVREMDTRYATRRYQALRDILLHCDPACPQPLMTGPEKLVLMLVMELSGTTPTDGPEQATPEGVPMRLLVAMSGYSHPTVKKCIARLVHAGLLVQDEGRDFAGHPVTLLSMGAELRGDDEVAACQPPAASTGVAYDDDGPEGDEWDATVTGVTHPSQPNESSLHWPSLEPMKATFTGPHSHPLVPLHPLQLEGERTHAAADGAGSQRVDVHSGVIGVAVEPPERLSRAERRRREKEARKRQQRRPSPDDDLPF